MQMLTESLVKQIKNSSHTVIRIGLRFVGGGGRGGLMAALTPNGWLTSKDLSLLPYIVFRRSLQDDFLPANRGTPEGTPWI